MERSREGDFGVVVSNDVVYWDILEVEVRETRGDVVGRCSDPGASWASGEQVEVDVRKVEDVVIMKLVCYT